MCAQCTTNNYSPQMGLESRAAYVQTAKHASGASADLAVIEPGFADPRINEWHFLAR